MPVLYAKIVNGAVVGNIQSEPFGSGSVSGVSGITEITGNITSTWDWGSSPVDSNGVNIYANWPYDDNGIFVGDYLKGKAANFTINWNIQPVGFNSKNVIPLFEKGGIIQNFTAINPTLYTFTYQPNVTPAQIVINKNTISNGSLKLNNNLYSQAILTEYRPYAVCEVSNASGDLSTYSGASVVDTAFSPPITRPYVVVPTGYTTLNTYYSVILKITFNNFVTGTTTIPTTYTEAGVTSSSTNRPYYFDSTDIISGISYSHYASGTTYPNNVSTTSYGFYVGSTPQVFDWTNFVNTGNKTTAQQNSKIRGVLLTAGTNADFYAGVMKFNVAKGSYVDKPGGNANTEGVPLYLGIFSSYKSLDIEITLSRATGIRYGNYTIVKFRLNYFTALVADNRLNSARANRGSITKPVVDTSDPWGLTFISYYTPNTTIGDYSDEFIYVPANTVVANGMGLYSINVYESQKNFSVKQAATKYLISSLGTNIKTPTIWFTVDTPIYADITTLTGAGTVTAPVALTVRDNNNNSVFTVLNSATGMLPTTGTTGVLVITIPLPATGLQRNTQYTVDIPSTFGISDYGTYLEDLTKTNITRTFTVDSNPITVTDFKFTNTISITSPTTYINSITFNKAILSINTSKALVTIEDTANPTVPLISIPFSTGKLEVQYPSTTLGGYYDTVLTSSLYNTNLQGFYYQNALNINRELRVDKTYQVTVHTDYCTDRYNNPAIVYTNTFSLTKTDLNIQSTYLENKLTGYDSVQVILTAPYDLYPANTSNVVRLTDGTNTYTSANSNIVWYTDDNRLVLTFSLSIYRTSTNYTLTIPEGFVEDYVGNKNIAYTKTFTTIAQGQTKGQLIFEGTAYSSPSYTFIAPFGATNISLVAIGGGALTPDINNSIISAGALAWINNIPVTPGDTFTVKLNLGGNTVITKNGVDLVTAEGGITGGTRSMPLFASSVVSGKTANTDYGGQAGGLGKASINSPDINSLPGGAGKYTGYDPNPALCAHGIDYNNNVEIIYSNQSKGSSLLGTIPGGGVLYGAGGTNSFQYNSEGSDYIFKEINPGAVRIIWGTGRAYPATNVADV